MMGTFGYELDLTKLAEEDLAGIPQEVGEYRKIQPLEETGDYYRLASFRENGWLDAVEIAGKDKKEAFVLAVQVLTQPNQKSTRLYLQGLDPAALYEVEGKVFPGDLLMQAGYPLQHVVHDMDARILWLRRVEA
jgi:alpha-galactosidase